MEPARGALTARQLVRVFRRLDRALNIGSSGYSFFDVAWKRNVETVAHEVAHWLVLGQPDPDKAAISDVVQTMLDERFVDDVTADRNEILTCAVEYRTLRRLGLTFDLDDLTYDAADMCRLDSNQNEEVLLARVERAVKTRDAKRLERQFIRLVRKHL